MVMLFSACMGFLQSKLNCFLYPSSPANQDRSGVAESGMPSGRSLLQIGLKLFVTIQAYLEGKTILGKTIKAFSPLKVQALQKKAKTFTQRRRAAKVPQRKALRILCVFASLRALLIFFLVAARPRWDNCFALNGFALIF